METINDKENVLKQQGSRKKWTRRVITNERRKDMAQTREKH